MEKVEQLEMAVGKPVEQWNISDLEKFSSEENLELLQCLKEPAVITECLERSKNNREVADVFVPLYVKALLSAAENSANDILKDEEDNKISKEDLLKEVENNFIASKCTFYCKLVGYLILISMFPDYKLEEHEIQIKESIANLKEVICGLVDKDLFNCYSLIIELIELLFPLRSKYFAKYKVDILDDEDKRIENALDSLHDLEMQIKQQLEAMAVSQGEVPEAIKEELQSTDEGDK